MAKVVGKLLNGKFTISSAAFAGLTPAQQGDLIKEADGKPILFIESFADFMNKQKLIDDLMAGKDIRPQMEFLGETFSSEEQGIAKAFKKLMDKIDGLNLYPWSKKEAIAAIDVRVNGNTVYNQGGYSCSTTMAKRVWKAASAYWANGTKTSVRGAFNGYNRSAVVTKDRVTIGCQVLSKAEVEAIAIHMGWEPCI